MKSIKNQLIIETYFKGSNHLTTSQQSRKIMFTWDLEIIKFAPVLTLKHKHPVDWSKILVRNCQEWYYTSFSHRCSMNLVILCFFKRVQLLIQLYEMRTLLYTYTGQVGGYDVYLLPFKTPTLSGCASAARTDWSRCSCNTSQIMKEMIATSFLQFIVACSYITVGPAHVWPCTSRTKIGVNSLKILYILAYIYPLLWIKWILVLYSAQICLMFYSNWVYLHVQLHAENYLN